MAFNYQISKQNELRSVHDNFSFSEQMRYASRNDLWRNKEALWTIISGICDDTAKECYSKIQNMVSEIADVETCNIHALKSIAKSVDAEFLVKDLKEDYDDNDILNLINLFSVQREILLNTNVYLHNSVTDKTFGYLTLKSTNLPPIDKVSIDLLYDIKRNINHLKRIFEVNFILLRSSVLDLLYYDLPDFKDHNDLIKVLKELTLDNMLNLIDNYKDDKNLEKFRDQKLIVNDEFNYFYLLINIIKQNYYRVDKQVYMLTSYLDQDRNKEVDMSNLIFKIVGTLFIDDDQYFNNYVGFHFFNTLRSKIENDKLKLNYKFDKKLNTFVFDQEKQNDMTKEEFIGELVSYITYDEAISFILVNKIERYRYEFIDFVKFCSNLNKELKILNIEPLELNVLKINYPEKFKDEEDKINDTLYGDNGILYHFTKLYIDECIHIKNLRNQLKNIIQQYTFIGTRRIATDIFYDFFIKNFSNKNSLSYFSSDYVLTGKDNIKYNFNEVKRDVNDLLKGTLSGDYEDDKFSVNIIEYYDETQYLNIKSELPLTYSESIITNYENVISTYIDENYLLASAYIKKPVYTVSYVPCSLFIKDYNEKFWSNENLYINSDMSISETKLEDYIKYYSQYINDVENLTIDVFKEKYIENELKPLLNKIWDTFALSGISEGDLDSDIGTLYKQYIGTNVGKNKYENHLNKIFPTIAPINTMENLVEVSKYDDDFLIYLAKMYYSSVLSKVKIATLKILRMYNEDSVPHEGWRQLYVTFNGYSTTYENSDNKLLYSIKKSELYKNNGPFIYRKLQDLLYEHYLSGTVDVNKLLKEYSNETIISSFYNEYFNGTLSEEFFDSDGNINVGKIDKYEEDIHENCYTLFKEEGSIEGKLFFRSYNMPISIPIIDKDTNYSIFSITNLDFRDILSKICNNCIDFGFLNEVMWIFGRYDEENYQLISFKYSFKDNFIIINPNTFISHYNSSSKNYLSSLNDFVGCFYDDHNINFILFDCYNVLSELSENYQDVKNYENAIDLFNLKLLIVTLNTETFEIKKKEVNNSLNNSNYYAVPMFLDHDYNSLKLKNNERIWKVMTKDNICYISYKSLNRNLNGSTFNYYFEYKTINIKIPSLIVSWNSDFNYVDINNIKDDMIFSLGSINDIIILKSPLNDNGMSGTLLNEDINSFLVQSNNINGLSECMFKNNRFCSKITPLNIGYQFDENFYKLLTEKIILSAFNKYVETSGEAYYLTFEKMIDIFNDEDVQEYMSSKKWLKSSVYNRNITFDDILSSYNEIISGSLSSVIQEPSSIIIDHNNLSDYNAKNIFEATNKYYETLPIIKNCCVNPLKVSFVFLNDSGITFINPNSLDLDITCYINDEVEKYKKVGYGNPYTRTNYLYWGGDVTDGGIENISVDVQKYINNKYQNADMNNKMKIVFNVCWHENSEIITKNLYVLVMWNNLIEKFPLALCGTNSLECNTKSFELNINMGTNAIEFDQAKLYPVIKLNYKEKLLGTADIPDIEVGTINLTNADFELLENNDWVKDDNCDYLYYHQDGLSISYLITKASYALLRNNNQVLLTYYKKLLSELIYYKTKDKIVNFSDILLDFAFFGIENSTLKYGVDFNYIIYLKPKYFNRLKSVKYKVNAALYNDLKELSYSLTEGE